MPHTEGKMFKFYDAEGNEYPFWAYSGNKHDAESYARRWSKRQGIKLYRKKEKS